MKKRFVVMMSNLFLLIGLHTNISAAEENNVRLEIVGLRNHNGSVNIAVFNKSEGFPSNSEKALRRLAMPISDNDKAITKLLLPKGEYAFAVFHDEDGNGKLNKNFIGIPNEGFGFSKDPKVKFTPPKFDDCIVTVGASEEAVIIHIQY